MRKLFAVAITALIMTMPVATLRAQYDALKAQKQVLKAKQKEERVALKLRKQYWQQSLRGQPLPKSERLRMKHQMDREERALRDRQKDEQQDFKDRQRLMKEAQKQL
jgi:type VI protein secretion system component VasK